MGAEVRIREAERSPPDRLEVLLLAGTVLLAAGLAFFRLDCESLWLDELYSALSSFDRDGLWHLVRSSEPNMLLYEVLLHYWMRLGDSEFLVRTPSAVFFVATVPLVWAVGRQLFGRRVALCAALFFATNCYMLRYAQEARAYSLAVALVTASTWLFLRALERPSLSRWTAYTACIVLALYAHLFTVLVVAAQMVSLVGRRARDVPFRGLVGSVATLVLGVLLLAVIAPFSGQPDWLAPPRLADIGGLYLTFAGGRLELALYLAVALLACLPGSSVPSRGRRGASAGKGQVRGAMGLLAHGRSLRRVHEGAAALPAALPPLDHAGVCPPPGRRALLDPAPLGVRAISRALHGGGGEDLRGVPAAAEAR